MLYSIVNLLFLLYLIQGGKMQGITFSRPYLLVASIHVHHREDCVLWKMFQIVFYFEGFISYIHVFVHSY